MTEQSKEECLAAKQELETLGADGRLALLASLATADVALGPSQGLRLALLLLDEDCLVAVVAALNPDTAESLWSALLAARRVCPLEAQEEVLSVFALASWFAGQSVALAGCFEQLEAIKSSHPVALLARKVSSSGQRTGLAKALLSREVDR